LILLFISENRKILKKTGVRVSNSIPILDIGTVQLVEDVRLGFFDVDGERKDDCGFIVMLNNGNAK
jgi:Cu/Ag efflux pump CusA